MVALYSDIYFLRPLTDDLGYLINSLTARMLILIQPTPFFNHGMNSYLPQFQISVFDISLEAVTLIGGRVRQVVKCLHFRWRLLSANQECIGCTNEMISHSSEFHFILELVMSEDFSADGIQSWIDNLGIFSSIGAHFYFYNTAGEAIDKFFRIVANDGRDDVNSRE